MAGDWIKFELTTLDKPEVCQIADLAGIDPDAVVGKLMRVWGWFDQQTENGNAPSVTKKLLDRLVGVTGFCDHMKSVEWMIEEEGVISLPHFDRHNGKTAKNRLLTAKRVASHKVKNAKGNGVSVSEALPKEDVEKKKDNNSSASDVRDAFTLSLDWQPDASRLKAVALRAGVPVVACDAALGAFTVHHEAKALMKTEAEWIAALVNWVKRDRTASAGNVRPFVRQTAPDFGGVDIDWANDLGAL